ncbi:MAG: hypothetical protein GX605_08950, partial [Chloroflexi bacterium]|nr:hypothetical protein [Chloroflexota bacterium]
MLTSAGRQVGQSRSPWPRLWVIALALFALAGGIRMWGIGQAATWDEPLWAFRSAHFLHALEQGRPAGTFQIGAPGVWTMWSGAAGIAAQRWLGHLDMEAWSRVIGQSSLDLEDDVTLKALGRLLPPMRAPLALLSAAAIGLAFRLLLRLRVAPLTALL